MMKPSETDARPQRRMNSRQLAESNSWANFLAKIVIVFAFVVLLGRLDVVAVSADDRVILLVTLFAFHCPALLRSAKICLALGRRRPEHVFVCRPRMWHVFYWLLAYVPVGFVLLISYGRLWTFKDVGATSSVHWGLSILVAYLRELHFRPSHIFFGEEMIRSAYQNRKTSTCCVAISRGDIALECFLISTRPS
jgi:hypothetical protein